MSQYILILIWLVAMGIIVSIIPVERYENVLGRKEVRVTWMFAICTFMPVLLMAAVRQNIGDSLLSSKIQKNLSEKWHFFKNAAFFDFFEAPVFSRSVANPNFT